MKVLLENLMSDMKLVDKNQYELGDRNKYFWFSLKVKMEDTIDWFSPETKKTDIFPVCSQVNKLDESLGSTKGKKVNINDS